MMISLIGIKKGIEVRHVPPPPHSPFSIYGFRIFAISFCILPRQIYYYNKIFFFSLTYISLLQCSIDPLLHPEYTQG